MNELTTDIDYIPLNLDLQQALTTEQAWHYGLIPREVNADALEFFIDETKIISQVKPELEVLFGKRIVLEKSPSVLIQKTLGKYYRKGSNGSAQIKKQYVGTTSKDFLQELIAEAKALNSSDIHIEAYEDRCRIRFRIDGNLIERYHISKTDYPSLINKIKVKANLLIEEKRLSQDGRIFFSYDNTKFDIRVSIVPLNHAEKIVLRLLSSDATNVDINSLGFAEDELSNYLEGIKRTEGIVLVSGPTGSGKTTSLYATLKILNKPTVNVMTVEDPIEYTLEGVNQVQVKESIGLTFASVLRTFLRQDPNIIMVGEIRDKETAEIAIRAALTGHLVLSTIHTNSAWGTISRLVDMGVEPFLVASTLNTSVAQRLVRLLCPYCKEKEAFSPKLYPKNFNPPHELTHHYSAKGCRDCHETGYKGRKAVYEVIPIDNELADNIKNNIFDVREKLKQRGLRTLAENAFAIFEKGETTIEEIYPILANSY